MKKIFIVAIMLLTVNVAFMHAQKGTFTENRTVKTFTSISTCCSIDVYISEGTAGELKVEVNHKDLLKGLETDVVGGVLRVSYDDGAFKRPRNTKMKVYLKANNLSSIESSSGSNVISETAIKATDINLSASSGGNINLDLKARDIECSSTSGSNIILKGNATSADLRASSGSNVFIQEMTVEVGTARATSGSNIKLNVTKEIHAKASSGSNITYSGSPKIVDTDKSSGGSIRKK